ncbi:helix-turn-helix transcriptional regulator [Aetokthonos hydrillicola Thurmond2011]|jgi:putative transcriptional regulator|uniref:Helix-turn-helix transcriptional regulator n=2 Tax=Aetokthonos TaxID=1550243 RepID=A0AAP5MCZ7_9CYAN|nr:helix-turn-helix transcriptional regulator [Aetokthonos hydrillicola CCALA 1050]MDR9898953.1 helix-turn-helix transcriptional regulator [Aetokthonos hydrillicola Thurmond2011]
MAAKGLSNKELADLINFHEVTISKLRSLRMPSRLEDTTLDLLCAALDCQPGDLLEYVPDDEDIADTELEETPSPQPSNSRRTKKDKSAQGKNTRALRARATKTRVAVWEDLRSPLTIKQNEKSTT